MIFLPIKICFNFNYNSSGELVYDMSIIVIFVCVFDILFSFFYGYYKDGFIIRNRSKIIRHYLKKDFFADFIPLIILILSV